MVYKYLYQDRQNQKCEGEVKAHSRAEAYARIRALGIRPFRVIGDDLWYWKPAVIKGIYLALTVALVALGVVALLQAKEIRRLQVEQVVADEEA